MTLGQMRPAMKEKYGKGPAVQANRKVTPKPGAPPQASLKAAFMRRRGRLAAGVR